jgi:Ca-activated chloride channel homolog
MTRSRLLSFLLLAAISCGGDYGSGSGQFGATPGGVKDMGIARELIANGQIPPPDALLVEGMFSEHDLGLVGPLCERTLCLRAASGIAPDAGGETRGWVQVGLSSTIDPDAWRRPSTTFVMTVDVSGSMGWGYGDDEYPTPGEVARAILGELGPRLTAADRVAIVTYGSEVAVPLPLTRGDDPRYLAEVGELSENGSTNMEAGLERAYAIARGAVADGETEQVRILLYTDVQPNVGATEPSQFERMVAAGADGGVGMTVLALGVGIGPEVLRSMAHLSGANAFSLFRFDDVETFIADEWPWFTTPIAFQLRLSVTPAEGFRVDQKYGFPTGEEPVGLEVDTIFLSKRKGALLFSMAPAEGTDLTSLRADMSLSYLTADGEPVVEPLVTAYGGQPLDERGQYFQQPATARATALALLVSGMHAAAAAYASDPAEAELLMRSTHTRFAADATTLADPSLDPEVSLSSALLDLIISRAPQGTLYGP